MTSHLLKVSILVCIALLLGCKSDDTTPQANRLYILENERLYFQGNEITLNGVNALHSFGLENLELMNSWNVQIVREFVGNLREQPISGGAVQGSDGAWLHPLDQIVSNNRQANMATIICPFGWVYPNGDQLLFTGLNPQDQDFFEDYEHKMKAIATHFAGQEDVWIEVWNEPYSWNNSNNYSHELWLNDMSRMVANLRNVNGFNNIIVVPGNEQGQSEDALIAKGQQLMDQDNHIIFDLHAYEKWLNNSTQTEIETRLQRLLASGFPYIFGEIGVKNVGDLMDPTAFLQAVTNQRIHTLAWLWKREQDDPSALLTETGDSNNLNNNNWGTLFYDFLNR